MGDGGKTNPGPLHNYPQLFGNVMSHDEAAELQSIKRVRCISHDLHFPEQCHTTQTPLFSLRFQLRAG